MSKPHIFRADRGNLWFCAALMGRVLLARVASTPSEAYQFWHDDCAGYTHHGPALRPPPDVIKFLKSRL